MAKSYNELLNESKELPKIVKITDEKKIAKYKGNKMYFAPPIMYDEIIRKIPKGELLTIGEIGKHLAHLAKASFTEPMAAGRAVLLAARASEERKKDKIPYWRVLKENGELNGKYPMPIEEQIKKLEKEGHKIISRGTKNIRYFVENYDSKIWWIV